MNSPGPFSSATHLGLLLAAAALAPHSLHSQDLSLNPTRPTVANSAGIQAQGVLQVETGYDAYPQAVPGNQQTVDTLITYTPLARLRLDFDWSAFNHQQSGDETVNGIGTIQIGGKVELKKEDYHRPAPGIAVQYEAELPTASQSALQGYGQQIILLANHHYGKDGDLDVLINGSLVQSDCNASTGCSYGGQQSVALSYHLQKNTRLYLEAFSQNVSQSNTPPGTYIFTGFYHASRTPSVSMAASASASAITPPASAPPLAWSSANASTARPYRSNPLATKNLLSQMASERQAV